MTNWLAPPRDLRLADDEVHVWCARLDADAGVIERMSAVLSPEEHERMERFVSAGLRNCYAVAHGVLRMILARYCRLEPQALRFRRAARGKPGIDPDCTALPVSFSMSDSGATGLYAVTLARRIGIDVEHLREPADLDDLARTSLSEREYGLFAGLAEQKRRRVFFRAWTVKEAFLKATGEGLHGLDKVEAFLGLDGTEPRLGVRELPTGESGHWTVRELVPGPECVGTVVSEGPVNSYSMFRAEY